MTEPKGLSEITPEQWEQMRKAVYDVGIVFEDLSKAIQSSLNDFDNLKRAVTGLAEEKLA